MGYQFHYENIYLTGRLLGSVTYNSGIKHTSESHHYGKRQVELGLGSGSAAMTGYISTA